MICSTVFGAMPSASIASPRLNSPPANPCARGDSSANSGSRGNSQTNPYADLQANPFAIPFANANPDRRR